MMRGTASRTYLGGMRAVARLFLGLPGIFCRYLIIFYRLFISPLKPRCCRFEPTCSTYALHAIARHGVLKGGILAVFRILRCHPFWNGDTYDPVPENFNLKMELHNLRFKR